MQNRMVLPRGVNLGPESAPQPGQRRWAALAAASAIALFGVGRSASGQVPATLNGPPVQVRPYVSEPGVPPITIGIGTLNPLPSGGAGGSGGDAGAGGGNVGPSNALNMMIGQPWGGAAVSAAQAVGVNPTALAATCVLESGCQNVGGSGSITGAFQMTATTYTSMINAAAAANPALANQIVPGLAGQNDPGTQAIAASEYLLQGAQALQAAGISDPSVLQTRGYYNFGPSSGTALASASPDMTMAAAMPNVSAATLRSNGITQGETVGQWQASITAKIGNAAGQSILGT